MKLKKTDSKAFQVGHVYGGSFVCNSDSHFYYVVIARTAKTVTVKRWESWREHDEPRRCRILRGDWWECETIAPMGASYSMAPILHANYELVEEA